MTTNNSTSVAPKIEESWKFALADEFRADYFKNLVSFVREEARKQVIYPPGKDIFSAFNHTPLTAVRVVLLGQDPYHGPGQAHGLCFSVPDGVPPPPSLKNIFKELHNDLGIEIPHSGNLTKWTRQGVMLLNATLTVRAHEAGSHQGQGWEQLPTRLFVPFPICGRAWFFCCGESMLKIKFRSSIPTNTSC